MSDERLKFLREASTTELPIQCTFEHRTTNARGLVELQYWPAKTSNVPPEQLTLFILGNPGLLNYYLPFLHHLHDLLPSTHAILSTSHIGHSTTLIAPSQPLDLPQHLTSKIELVDALQVYLKSWADEMDSGTPKLALMGHSVGAWLCCEVMKRNQGIHAGYLLFPTLGWIANSWNGKTLWPLFNSPLQYVIPSASSVLRPLLGILPLPPTSRSFVKSPSSIKHVLAMARSEMAVIRDLDSEWFRRQAIKHAKEGKGLFGVWAGGNLDGWVGKDGPLVREYLGGQEGGRVVVLDGVPHAFCLTQEHSEMVARSVASWIVPSAIPPTTDAGQAAPIGSTVGPM